MKIIDRIKSSAFDRFYGAERAQLERMTHILTKAYGQGGIVYPKSRVISELVETDSRLIDALMRASGSANIQGSAISENDRKMVIRRARYMASTNGNIERATELWSSYALGSVIKIAADNETANAALDEFVLDNKAVLGASNSFELSDNVLSEGESLIVYWYSPTDKKPTIRTIPTDEIRVVTLPDDPELPIWYVHALATSNERWYPDWRATKAQLNSFEIPRGAERMDSAKDTVSIGGVEKPNTVAVAQWNRRHTLKINGIRRGLPQFLNAFEYADLLKDFVGDRAAVAKKSAMYTDIVTMDGGSRLLGQAKNSLQSGLMTSGSLMDTNAPPLAGSDWLQNEGVSREWQERDTEAQSARFDARLIAGQLSVGAGPPLHWMGFPDALNNRATADEIRLPWIAQINRLHIFWLDLFTEMGQVVLTIQGIEGAVQVMLDTPSFVSVDDITASIDSIGKQVQAETMDTAAGAVALDALAQVLLLKLGIEGSFGNETPGEAESVYNKIIKSASGDNADMAEFLIGELKDILK